MDGPIFNGKEGWQKPENIVASVDHFLAATIAYGHIGWLVEETHGIRQTCRSYYMLQPLQSRYAMLKPQEISYGTDHGLVSSSQAFTNGDWRKSKIFVHYPDDLRIWVNGNAEESWRIEYQGAVHELPPFGWLAIGTDGFYEWLRMHRWKAVRPRHLAECILLTAAAHGAALMASRPPAA